VIEYKGAKFEKKGLLFFLKMFKTSSSIDSFKFSVPDHIAGLMPYPPAKPIEELERDYGLTGSIKPASNDNPLRPPPMAVAAIREALTRLHRYPDGCGYTLRKRLSGKFHLPFDIEVPTEARVACEAMLRQGVIIRPMNAHVMTNTICVNAGLPEENERFVRALDQTLHELQGSN
jgi:histidinol-phosphate/aromatic aminotransferase/cobyric acid decarboxylase-like protein